MLDVRSGFPGGSPENDFFRFPRGTRRKKLPGRGGPEKALLTSNI